MLIEPHLPGGGSSLTTVIENYRQKTLTNLFNKEKPNFHVINNLHTTSTLSHFYCQLYSFLSSLLFRVINFFTSISLALFETYFSLAHAIPVPTSKIPFFAVESSVLSSVLSTVSPSVSPWRRKKISRRLCPIFTLKRRFFAPNTNCELTATKSRPENPTF